MRSTSRLPEARSTAAAHTDLSAFSGAITPKTVDKEQIVRWMWWIPLVMEARRSAVDRAKRLIMPILVQIGVPLEFPQISLPGLGVWKHQRRRGQAHVLHRVAECLRGRGRLLGETADLDDVLLVSGGTSH